MVDYEGHEPHPGHIEQDVAVKPRVTVESSGSMCWELLSPGTCIWEIFRQYVDNVYYL